MTHIVDMKNRRERLRRSTGVARPRVPVPSSITPVP